MLFLYCKLRLRSLCAVRRFPVQSIEHLRLCENPLQSQLTVTPTCAAHQSTSTITSNPIPKLEVSYPSRSHPSFRHPARQWNACLRSRQFAQPCLFLHRMSPHQDRAQPLHAWIITINREPTNAVHRASHKTFHHSHHLPIDIW
jgi:hypothetical protein